LNLIEDDGRFFGKTQTLEFSWSNESVVELFLERADGNRIDFGNEYKESSTSNRVTTIKILLQVSSNLKKYKRLYYDFRSKSYFFNH
jgi:hypothetical protein